MGLTKIAEGPGNLALAEHREPTPGSHEVIIEVHGAGICGTDLHIEAGEDPRLAPVALGHGGSGRVLAVGDGVAKDWLNQRVVSETFFSTCGTCQWCPDGRPNLCPERRSIGSHVNGAFAPQVIVPERNLHPIPDWLDSHAAPLAEPLACVCQCLLDRPTVTPGDNVVVTGPGPIGLLAAQVSRLLGGQVTVVGLPTDQVRLEIAEKLGFASVADDATLQGVTFAFEPSAPAA